MKLTTQNMYELISVYLWTIGRKVLNSSVGKWRRWAKRAHAVPALAPATASLMSASSAPTSFVPLSRSSTWKRSSYQQLTRAVWPACLCMNCAGSLGRKHGGYCSWLQATRSLEENSAVLVIVAAADQTSESGRSTLPMKTTSAGTAARPRGSPLGARKCASAKRSSCGGFPGCVAMFWLHCTV